ncbi:MAG: adenylate/guanylate cyclase domain-containing protein [Rhodospirillaceae bacterium]|jgi:adenylate cyclase
MSLTDSKVLVVDDDQFNRNLITRQLNQEGYEQVALAEDGRQAVDQLKNNEIDVVLLDIEMPEMNGYEVLDHIKADMQLRHIPVIMISAIEEIDSIVKCIEAGAEDYLPKPFKPTLLRARLNACLEKKKMRDQETTYLSQIKQEKKRGDDLLNVILPAAAASELKATGKVEPRGYDNIAVLFCDVVNFTSFCSAHSATEVVSNLQLLFQKFEELIEIHQMEKIKTIGDEFMATAGLLVPNREPLLSAIRCGLEMGQAVVDLDIGWEVRAGVHVSPIHAGIVGDQKYQFDVWGDTVNIAARMTGPGSPGTVCMAHEAWLEVQNECSGRSLGRIDVKGKGQLEVIECTGVNQ